MKETKKCVIVGLPGAGKSTFIGAFWAIEKNGDSGHKLTCVKYPENTVYLDTLKKNWLEQSNVQRTLSEIPQEMQLTLHSSSLNEDLELHIPDFKGEIFQKVLMNNASDKITDWLISADCILYFVKNLPADTLQDEMPSDDNNEVNNKIMKPIQIEDISEWTQNIMLLKYLCNKMGKDIPISICLSAWDEVETTVSVDQWIKTNRPFFHNFIDHHFTNFKLFAISAQGLKYNDDKFDEYQRLTKLKKRAYVYTDHKSFDITEPLDYLFTK